MYLVVLQNVFIYVGLFLQEFKLVDAENGTNSTSTTSTSLGRRFGPTSPWKKWAIISAFSLGFLIYVAHNGPGFIIGHPPPPPPRQYFIAFQSLYLITYHIINLDDLSAIQDDFSNDFPDYYQPDYEKPHKKPSFDLPNSGVDNPLIDVTKDQSAKYGGSLSEAEASLPDDHQSIVNEQTFPSFSEEAPLNSELPTSFENDPNPSSTLACKSPHPDAINKGRPIVQYVVMIDAGSTGSRVHAYKFNNCHSTPQLEYETFKATEPGRGLSSFAGNPEGAARSLDPLLNEAVRVIPSHLHAQTPIAVKATAGLRILDTKVGPNASKEILDRVRSHVKLKYPFSVSDRPGDISVMDGSDEGVYAWITVNYLLERVGSDIDNKKLPTVAVMDLGGASTQIVFEPMSKTKDAIPLADGDHKYTLTYGGKQHVLYQHSYLGYGLMQARRSVHNLVAYLYEFGNPLIPDWNSWTPETIKVPNPCMPKGMQKIVQLDPPNKKHVSVTMVGASHGWDSCNRVVELVMAKDA